MLKAMAGQRAFLDSQDLVDLRTLFEHGVHASDVVVLLATKGVLTRPWCLLELLWAIESGVPIVGVNIVNDGYDFADASEFLLNLKTRLTEPDSVKLLADNGFPDLERAGATLHAVVPKVISMSLDFARSARVLGAMDDGMISHDGVLR